MEELSYLKWAKCQINTFYSMLSEENKQALDVVISLLDEEIKKAEEQSNS